MMCPEEPIKGMARLMGILQEQTTQARLMRDAAAKLDIVALVEATKRREALAVAAAQAERAVEDQLIALAGKVPAPGQVTPVAEPSPNSAEKLDAIVRELRGLAEELSVEDALLHEVAAASLAFARAYLVALTPSGSAYDRHGTARLAPTPSTTHRRA